MPEIDVATLPEEFANATSAFEMWELTGLAQTAVAQRTDELKTSVDKVETAVADGGQKAVAAINGVKDATGDLKASVENVKTAVTEGGKNAVTSIDGVSQATYHLRGSVEEVKTAVRSGSDRVATEIQHVHAAGDRLTYEAARIADHLRQLVDEFRHHKEWAHANFSGISEMLRPIAERSRLDEATAPATPPREYLEIIAPEGAKEATREHLNQLRKTVDAAIRGEKLAEFLEHIRRWEDPGSSRAPHKRGSR
jgi:uncharacterized protein YoxC